MHIWRTNTNVSKIKLGMKELNVSASVIVKNTMLFTRKKEPFQNYKRPLGINNTLAQFNLAIVSTWYEMLHSLGTTELIADSTNIIVSRV